MNITATKLRLNMHLDSDLVMEVATELNVDPSFIEKDWYATEVMKVLSTCSGEQIRPLFCGGTSLSKCHGLLKRFSEDLDYRGIYDDGAKPGRGARSRYREIVVSGINDIEGLSVDERSISIGSNFFKIDLNYKALFKIPNSLRQKLKIEFSFTQAGHEDGFAYRPVTSLIGNYVNEAPSFETECISPLETAADKLSALIWRVIKRNRSSDKDDPSIVRHLHDLYALKDIIQVGEHLFEDMVNRSYSIDSQTPNRSLGIPILEAIETAHGMILSDKEYSREYLRFVSNMSFASEDETIQLLDATNHLESLISCFSSELKPSF